MCLHGDESPQRSHCSSHGERSTPAAHSLNSWWEEAYVTKKMHQTVQSPQPFRDLFHGLVHLSIILELLNLFSVSVNIVNPNYGSVTNDNSQIIRCYLNMYYVSYHQVALTWEASSYRNGINSCWLYILSEKLKKVNKHSGFPYQSMQSGIFQWRDWGWMKMWWPFLYDYSKRLVFLSCREITERIDRMHRCWKGTRRSLHTIWLIWTIWSISRVHVDA